MDDFPLTQERIEIDGSTGCVIGHCVNSGIVLQGKVEVARIDVSAARTSFRLIE